MLLVFTAGAQQVRPSGSAGIYHELRQLGNLTHVMYLAAHPDDENTRLLSWLVNERHIPTTYLSLTRGDGGQNILGTEQGPPLGLIRTYELLEARKIDGARQLFTRAIDFGFSKTSEETLKQWNEDLIVSDIVYAIRKTRPDVIICRFPPTRAAGHGHHAASAILAEKAFEATGNPARYTTQLRFADKWQPRRLLFNAHRYFTESGQIENMIQLTVGQYNPLTGMGCGEIAGISRSIHRSQGAGTPSIPGTQTEYFDLVSGDLWERSFFEGIDTTWNRVGRPDIDTLLAEITAGFDWLHPEKLLPGLIRLRTQIEGVTDTFWRRTKLEDLDRLILDAGGIMAECFSDLEHAVAGSRQEFQLQLVARGGSAPVRLLGVKWPDKDSTCRLTLPHDSLIRLTRRVAIPAQTPVTEPYWLSTPSRDGVHFPVPADSLLGLPEAPNSLYTQVRLDIGGTEIQLKVPLSYKKLDPVRGDVITRLQIVPEASVSFDADMILSRTDGSVQTAVRIFSFADIKNATLELSGNNESLLRISNLKLARNTDTLIPVEIPARHSRSVAGAGGHYYLSASLRSANTAYGKSRRTISYDHLPPLQYFVPATAKVVMHNWKVNAKRIGYIPGAGDLIPEVLRQAGLQVDILGPKQLSDAKELKQYDAIITGIRALNTEKRMAWWMPVLLRYAHEGGTLIVQYNNPRNLSTDRIGPYPLEVANIRTTEEQAEVQFKDPQHRLLQVPNRITREDFKDWVQERGLYFAKEWDPKYQPLFRMHDTGEDPQDGATLYASYGKGHYIYTSLSFFRQLPAGNPGALKLFMNMLSLRDPGLYNKLIR